MDPITLIVAALAAGAASGTAGVASAAVADAYASLKALAVMRLGGRPDAELVLARHEQTPEVWRMPLIAELAGAAADRDPALIRAAGALMMLLVDEVGAGTAKYAVDAQGAQGVQVGDHSRQENVFYAQPGGLDHYESTVWRGDGHVLPVALRPEAQLGDGGSRVDARGASGVLIGEGGTQIIYSYNRLTWTDGVVPSPLVDVSGVVESPYRGLGAFEERDAPFFFGRETSTTEVLERMSWCAAGTGLLVVSGVSGAGKSSLLQAGVLPRLRGAGLTGVLGSTSWPCLVLTPGHGPLDELAVRVASLAGVAVGPVRDGLTADPAGFALTARQAAMARTVIPDTAPEGQAGWPRLLIVVDQFEQLFTQCADEEQRKAFIAALHAAATARRGPGEVPGALVVLGIRADFEALCAGYPQLVGAIQDRYLVTAMTERQLRMAITEPAKQAGARVDDDLVEVLLHEVRSRQATESTGVLPLLSHALDQAWRNRAGDILTISDYERTGGIEGAVAASAQRAYDKLTSAQQSAARRIFTRLTAASSDGVDTADRAARSELTEGKTDADTRDVEAVLEAFAAERLLTLAVDTVEISHEVLLSAWPLMRDTWLTDAHADRIVRTRLRAAAADWTRGSRDQSYLYNGTLLTAAAAMAGRIDAAPLRHAPLSRTEQEFLGASHRAHQKRTRLRQSVLAVLMVLVVGVASVAVVAFRARQEAVSERNAALSGQLISRSEALGNADPALSRLESLAAWHVNPSSAARYAMFSAAALPCVAILDVSLQDVDVVAFGHGGKVMATYTSNGSVRLWDVATHKQIGKTLFIGAFGAKSISPVAFSPDGRTLAIATVSGLVRLWDIASGQATGSPIPAGALVPPRVFPAIDSVAFSPDGKTLATADGDGTVRLWNVVTREQTGNRIDVGTQPVNSVAFSPDGKTLAAADGDGTVGLWNVANGLQIGGPLGVRTRQVSDPVGFAAFSPDGEVLAGVTGAGTARLWDVATHRQIRSPLYGGGQVNAVAFNPGNKILATADGDGTVRLWNVANGLQIGTPLNGDAGPVDSVAFSPDGDMLASANYDGTVRLWDMTRLTETTSLSAAGSDSGLSSGGVVSMAFSPDGKTLAAAGSLGTVLWDPATRRRIGRALLSNSGSVYSIAFNPQGKILATATENGVVLLDLTSRKQIGSTFKDGKHQAGSLAFSPDGKILAAGYMDGKVQLWSVSGHFKIATLPEPDLRGSSFGSLAFSPDGKALAGVSAVGTVLWDVATRKQIGKPFAGRGNVYTSMAFSPDGRMLAVGSGLEVQLWRLADRRQVGNPFTSNKDPFDVVGSVRFSPDGQILAIGSADGMVRLWDTATEQEIGDPLTASVGRGAPVTAVAFTSDGRTLAVGTGTATTGAPGAGIGTVRLWDFSHFVDVAPHLCAAAKRTLTRSEWGKYVPGLAYRKICT